MITLKEELLYSTNVHNVDLKIKPFDGFFLILVGTFYASMLVGLIYFLTEMAFLKGIAHGILLGFCIGSLSWLAVYFNNQYVLPRLKRVVMWWVVWCGTAFLIGMVGFLWTYIIVRSMGGNVPPFLTDEKNVIISAFTTGFLTYFTGLLVYLFVRMRNRKELIERLAIEADYKLTLRMLDVHFLLNSLNTLLELVDGDKELLEKYTGNLVRYLRGVLKEAKMSTLREELALVKSYVFLEKVRKGRDIVLSVEADESLLDEPVPSLILQPIVENAIRHGLPEDKTIRFGISIGAKKVEKFLMLTLLNNGKPIEEFKPGVGLSLLKKKLEAHGGRLLLKSKNPPCFIIELPVATLKVRGAAYEGSDS